MPLANARERLALQWTVAAAACVPVAAGLAGAIGGAAFVGEAVGTSADSHFRYLSGILLAIGLGFWSSIPRIEGRARRFALLTALVACGGLARLAALPAGGLPNAGMMFGLAMELLVTPAVCLWQFRVARRAGSMGA